MPTSFIAEVVVVHPELPLAPTLQENSTVNLRVESQPHTDPELPIVFYAVTDSDFQEFESSLTTDKTVKEWHVTMEFRDCRIYRISHDPVTKFMTPKLADLGIHAISIKRTEQGWYVQLQTPDKESLGEFWEYCREEEVEFALEKLYSSGSQATTTQSTSLKAQLTNRQQEVARTVSRMGYYDQEGASAEEVAAALDIAPSTLSTHLRRIMATIFEYMFEAE